MAGSGSRGGPNPGHFRRPVRDIIDRTWMEQAECDGLPDDWWFPQNNRYDKGRRVCRRCPVRMECLGYALYHQVEYGLWGAASPRQRKQMLIARQETKEAAALYRKRRSVGQGADMAGGRGADALSELFGTVD